MAAGLGFKTFTTGEVLTAGDVNGYLMQGVLVFADAAARTAAITSPQEGQVTFLKDTNSTEYYSGSAWVAIDGSVPTSLGFTAGKNRIINGDFGVWQRGTSFSSPSDDTYSSADRWKVSRDGSPTFTVSQQAATPAAITGYDPQYYLRYNVTVLGGATSFGARQRIEDVRTFAGQTATVSFWIKSDATRAITFYWQQNFGSGGSSTVTSSAISIGNATTSWTRLTATFAIDSISGKTIGAGNYLAAIILLPGATQTTDIWGVQLELGSIATAFQTATGTIQGELAACQRYYYRLTADTTYSYLAFGMATSTTNGKVSIPAPSTMRVVPTAIDSPTASTLRFTDGVSGTTCNASPTLDADATNELLTFNVGVASGLTQYRPIWFGANNSSSAYIGFSAEL